MVAANSSIFIFTLHLKWVANSEMKGVGILETIDVEIARFASVVREMEGYPPIEADDEKTKVVPKADACA